MNGSRSCAVSGLRAPETAQDRGKSDRRRRTTSPRLRASVRGMTEQQDGVPVELNMTVPPEVEAGVFATFAGIWTDDDGFFIDFATVAEPPQKGQNDAGAEVVRIR